VKSIQEMIASRESEKIEFKAFFGKEVIETLYLPSVNCC